MLLGALPLGRAVKLKGRTVNLSEMALEEWASGNLMVPVLVDHDPDRLVGWCDRVKFDRGWAWLHGDLDPEQPGARGVARLVRTGAMDGLSPLVRATRGEVFYKAAGRWAEGNVITLPELSVVWEPQLADARWLGC